MKYPIKTDFLKAGTGRRPGTLIPGGKPRFIVLHDTGNPNSTAANNIGYYSRSLSMKAGAQVFIDDKEIIECIPVRSKPEKARHVMYNRDRKTLGLGAANDYAIGLEMCFFPGNKSRSEEAYQRTVWYAAYIAKLYNMNINNCLVGHEHLDPRRKVDSSTGLRATGRTYNQMVADIKAIYHTNDGKGGASTPSTPSFNPANTTNPGYVTIKVTSLNVRKGPGVNHPKVKELKTRKLMESV